MLLSNINTYSLTYFLSFFIKPQQRIIIILSGHELKYKQHQQLNYVVELENALSSQVVCVAPSSCHVIEMAQDSCTKYLDS